MKRRSCLKTQYRFGRDEDFAALGANARDSSDNRSYQASPILILARMEAWTARIKNVATPVDGDRFQINRHAFRADLTHDQLYVGAARDRYIPVACPNVSFDMTCVNSASIPLTNLDLAVWGGPESVFQQEQYQPVL